MRRLVFISLFLFLFAACTRQELVATLPDAPLHSELTAIDTLMQTEPDSALFALLPLAENDSLTPFDRHYADLLVSEALFKNDYEQTTRSALLDALSYFDSIADAYPQNDDYILLSARSHYMDGVGLMEADSVVEACTEYLQALQIMENHFDDKELIGYKAKFMALIYNRLGELFSNHLMTEQALACYKESLSFCRICPTSKYAVSNTMAYIGTHFSMLNQSDSALYYFNMAEKLLPDTSNIVYRDILTSQTILLYDKKKIKKDKVLKVLSAVKATAETEQELVSRELIISEIFFKEKQNDSAQAYLEKVFYSNIDMLSKIQAARYLNEIHIKKGETEKADFYNSFLAPLAVESYEQKNKESQMVELFESHRQQTLHNYYKTEKNSLTRMIAWAVGILIFVVIPIIIYTKRKRHLRKISDNENRFKLEKQQHTALVNRMQNANARLREENQKLSKNATLSAFISKEKTVICDYETLINEPICSGLLNRFSNTDIITTNPSSYYSNLAISQEEKRKFVDTIERLCPEFTTKLTLLYPNLGKTELSVCQYILIGLTIPQIAVLTQKDFSTLWRNERNIKSKIGCTNIHSHLKCLFFQYFKVA